MSLEQILKKEVNNVKYVITTAQYGAKINKPFYDNLKYYCKKEQAELLIFPIRGAYKDDDALAEMLYDEKIITKDIKFNSNVKAMSYDVTPQQIDPLTGLIRFTQDDTTTILPATKIRLKSVPNSNIKHPKLLVTTGALTLPNYRDNRIGNIAKYDHSYGAVFLETKGQKYNLRHLNANANGVFYDIGYKYNKGKKTKTRPEVTILGDWHTGQTDNKVRKTTFKYLKETNPKKVILHDFFNAYSISHHDEGKIIQQYEKRNITLEQELKMCADELKYFCDNLPKTTDIYIVKSNHDEHLDKYLNEGRFITDYKNIKLSAELLVDVLNKEDALYSGLKRFYNIPKNVHFLDRKSDLKVRGWQLGNHGDLGAHGSRASLRSIEYANGKSITGHGHYPEIFRNVYKVGTSSILDMGYNRGYNAWLHTHGSIYSNGKPQLINIINGVYKF